MARRTTILCTIALAAIAHFAAGIWQQREESELSTLKQWTTLSFDFPWDWPRGDREFYAPDQVVATGIEVFNDRIFIATPRLFSGVPATLSVLNKADDSLSSSTLQAYPNWGHHAAGLKAYNCSDLGLISVYRLKIDACNRLWALDAGVSRSLEDFEVTCPPKILVYDLHSDQVVRRIDFPAEVVRPESLFTNLVIDDTTSRPENHCDDVFIYITDTVEPGLIVYDSGNDVTWRLSHPSMFPDPDFQQLKILNDEFTLMDGVVGIAFDKPAGLVYFQPFATDRLFSVPTKALRAGPLGWGQSLPVRLVGKKSSQGIGLAVSARSGAILFSPMAETSIGSWNPYTNAQNVLAADQERVQFVADIVVPRHDPGSIYVLSSRFHRYFLKNLDKDDINVRIMRMRDLTRETHALPVPSRPLITPGNSKPTTSTPPPAPTSPIVPANNYFGSHSTSYSHFSTPYHFIKSTFNFNHQLPSTKAPSPYPFEPVGVVNKEIRNPFFLLNSGERPSFHNDIHRSYDTSSSHRHYPSDASHSSAYYFAHNHS